MIIGIAGTFASGKGTVVEYLKSKGFTHYSSSGRLKEILTERGLPQTRDNLSSVAEELLSKYKGGVLEFNLERAKQDGAEDIIVEAIHRMSEADFVRSVGGKILGLDADMKVRYERTLARGDGDKDAVTFEQFKEHAEREEEGRGNITSNIRAVIESADAIVVNNGTPEEMYPKIDEALKKLGL
jgi:dephospho-CoA kinase